MKENIKRFLMSQLRRKLYKFRILHRQKHRDDILKFFYQIAYHI